VPELESRLLAGRLPGDADGPLAVVTEGLLYDLGARDEAAFAAAVGRPLGVAVGPPEAKGTAAAAVLANVLGGGLRPAEAAAVGKLLLDMPRLLDQSSLTAGEKATLRAAFTQPGQARPLAAEPPLAVTVAGVVRAAAGDDSDVVYRFRGGWVYDRGDVFLPRPVGEPMLRRLPAFKAGLYDTAGVRVRPGADLPAVAEAATRMGFRTASAAEWYAGARMQVTAITGGLNVFGLLALFVAGLGITNTLVTSVIERTGEIGVLRAVGATAAQVRGLFLAEGGLIGLAGGLVGLAAARLAAGPADRYVLRVARDQTRGERLLSETVFEFPWWLSAGAVLFAVLVTTLAAAYPARRAARLTPVEALRYG
jgi:putative ABC transport system permease protein